MKNLKVSGVLVYLLGLVLVLLLYFYFIFTPLSSKAAQLDMEHGQNTAKLQMYQQQIQQGGKLTGEINDLQSELDKLKQSAGVTGKTAAEDIGKACDSAGVTPTDIQIGNETADKSKTSASGQLLYSVPVNLKAVCTNAQLLSLLDYFENKSQGAYYVNTVTYAWEANATPAEFSLTLYYFGVGETKK